jgi:hypothetical protein
LCVVAQTFVVEGTRLALWLQLDVRTSSSSSSSSSVALITRHHGRAIRVETNVK